VCSTARAIFGDGPHKYLRPERNNETMVLAMDNDRRRHKRINRNFMARVQVRQNKLLPDWDIVTLQNLSPGGMLFSYDKSVVPGMFLDFKISFPAAEGSIDGTGEILRTQLRGNALRDVAVYFTEMKEAERALIRDFEGQVPAGTEQDQDVKDVSY